MPAERFPEIENAVKIWYDIGDTISIGDIVQKAHTTPEVARKALDDLAVEGFCTLTKEGNYKVVSS